LSQELKSQVVVRVLVTFTALTVKIFHWISSLLRLLWPQSWSIQRVMSHENMVQQIQDTGLSTVATQLVII